MLKGLQPIFSAFVFIVTPISGEYKSFVSHVYFTTHANYQADIKLIN